MIQQTRTLGAIDKSVPAVLHGVKRPAGRFRMVTIINIFNLLTRENFVIKCIYGVKAGCRGQPFEVDGADCQFGHGGNRKEGTETAYEAAMQTRSRRLPRLTCRLNKCF